MDDGALARALERADRALARIEQALETRRGNGRDEELRGKVREAVAELDQLIRAAGGLMAEVDLIIAGRPYRVACRTGEEETLRAAARLVDAKSREAISGLGTLSEARQLLFAALLLADQLIEQDGGEGSTAPGGATGPDPELTARADRLAARLESLAQSLENQGSNA